MLLVQLQVAPHCEPYLGEAHNVGQSIQVIVDYKHDTCGLVAGTRVFGFALDREPPTAVIIDEGDSTIPVESLA